MINQIAKEDVQHHGEQPILITAEDKYDPHNWWVSVQDSAAPTGQQKQLVNSRCVIYLTKKSCCFLLFYFFKSQPLFLYRM